MFRSYSESWETVTMKISNICLNHQILRTNPLMTYLQTEFVKVTDLLDQYLSEKTINHLISAWRSIKLAPLSNWNQFSQQTFSKGASKGLDRTHFTTRSSANTPKSIRYLTVGNEQNDKQEETSSTFLGQDNQEDFEDVVLKKIQKIQQEMIRLKSDKAQSLSVKSRSTRIGNSSVDHYSISRRYDHPKYIRMNKRPVRKNVQELNRFEGFTSKDFVKEQHTYKIPEIAEIAEKPQRMEDQSRKGGYTDRQVPMLEGLYQDMEERGASTLEEKKRISVTNVQRRNHYEQPRSNQVSLEGEMRSNSKKSCCCRCRCQEYPLVMALNNPPGSAIYQLVPYYQDDNSSYRAHQRSPSKGSSFHTRS